MNNDKQNIDDASWIGKHLPCPKCGSSDAASYNNRGVFHCFSCESNWYDERYDESNNRNKQESENIMNDISVNDTNLELPEGVYTPIKDRGISEETCRKYGVTCDLDFNGNIITHHYPYYDNSGQMIAVKTRQVSTKQFSWSGQARLAKQMFGQQLFGANNIGQNILFITEGCLDAMAVWDMVHFPAVSVANGATSLVKQLKDNYDFVNSFDKVFILMDNDKVGREALEQASSLFPPRKTFIGTADKGKGCKDPCDYLKRGLVQDFKKDMWWNAKQYIPDGIYDDPGAIWDEVKNERNKGGGHPYPWVGLNKMLFGMSPGELITVTAGSGCVDADTEFFSQNGWKKISEYQEGDFVLQYDKNTFEASLVQPEDYIKKPCDRFYHFDTKYGLDMMLSSEHNVLYVPEESTVHYKMSAEEVAQRGSRFRGRIPTTFKYSGSGIPLSDTEIKLMLAVIADSSICSSKAVTFNIKKQRKKDELKTILQVWGQPYNWYDRKDGYSVIRLRPPRLEKEFTKFWYNCSQEQLQLICNNVLKWDGSVTNGRKSFSTTSKQSADFIQFAFSSCGYRARITNQDRRGQLRGMYARRSIEYEVHITDRNFVGMRNSKGPQEVSSLDGFKYCFTVPTGCLILRRNGCIFCTGNSGKTSFLRELQYHLLKTSNERLGVLMLEETIGRSALGLMSIEANLPLQKPDVFVSDEELKQYYDRTIGLGKISFYGGFKCFDIDTIKARIEYMIQGCDCKYIFLDHISILVSNQEVSDERRTLDAVCHCLAELAVSYNVCIIMVSHLRRTGAKPHEEGGQTSLQDLRGSQGIAQLSFTVLGIERNQQAKDPDERNTLLVRVLKNRKFGETGPACKLKYDQETGRLTEIEGELEDETLSTEDKPPEFDDKLESEVTDVD